MWYTIHQGNQFVFLSFPFLFISFRLPAIKKKINFSFESFLLYTDIHPLSMIHVKTLVVFSLSLSLSLSLSHTIILLFVAIIIIIDSTEKTKQNYHLMLACPAYTHAQTFVDFHFCCLLIFITKNHFAIPLKIWLRFLIFGQYFSIWKSSSNPSQSSSSSSSSRWMCFCFLLESINQNIHPSITTSIHLWLLSTHIWLTILFFLISDMIYYVYIAVMVIFVYFFVWFLVECLFVCLICYVKNEKWKQIQPYSLEVYFFLLFLLLFLL